MRISSSGAIGGKELIELHLNFENIQPYDLKRERVDVKEYPRPKLKALKGQDIIVIDENTQISAIPAITWDYKLGNRSALEWLLHQYKESKPKDNTIAGNFNVYRVADYKEQLIDLLARVCS